MGLVLARGGTRVDIHLVPGLLPRLESVNSQNAKFSLHCPEAHYVDQLFLKLRDRLHYAWPSVDCLNQGFGYLPFPQRTFKYN